ncbi:hypothetical protein [Aureimonas pseudogalii]|uniref:Uncharacterized protein n=1 Tax=Aureimonas pseudogalii TaxID=1744844 RepID=A0A7W6MK87_9HYPH|nr:hypothetical protein [Aureimonas pseudogalii]MBB3998862.1 hypothetical protein [Aureimonas pseudogalii]
MADRNETTPATEKPLVRDDGSKVATEGSPSGETETEKVRREESRLPNRGVSPDYTDPVDEDGIAVIDESPAGEHGDPSLPGTSRGTTTIR